MIRKIFISIVLAGLTMTFYSCNRNKAENLEGNGIINETFLPNIKTVKTVLSNQNQELVLTGKVDFNPDKIISFTPLVDGVIVRTYFSLDEKVRKGQPLFDMRSTELSALQTEKISLETEKKIAERELRAAQSMFEDNMVSEIELLEAEGNLRQIRAEINRIEADMHVFGTNRGNGIFTVHAPISGYIIQKQAPIGSTISPDDEDAVFTIADLSTVWVTVNVHASNLLFVRRGMAVEITTFAYPGKVFHGKINTMSHVFDPEERVLNARIRMDNSDLLLKPGMFVLVTLKDESSQRFIAVPSDALIFDDNQYFVVVEETRGNFAIRNVVLQGQNNNTTYILSGLSEGENVVITNQLLIYVHLKELK